MTNDQWRMTSDYRRLVRIEPLQ